MTQVFPMAADHGMKGVWSALILVPILALLLYFTLAPRFVRFEVLPSQLRISGDPIYRRTIPLKDLDVQAAQAVDLTNSSEYRLTWRTNGIGLPNYKGGWFRIAKGGKALVFVGDARRTVVIPHREGYVVILSPDDPDAFVRALKGAGPTASI